MLVIMAVVTTLMAGPLLKLLDPKNEYGRGRRGRVRRRRASCGPGSPRAAGARALDPGRSADRRRASLSWSRSPSPWPARRPPRELIIARLVRPPRGAGAGVRGGLAVREPGARAGLAARSTTLRERLATDGVVARGVALTSTNPGSDLAHIVEREPVDLVLTEGRRRLIGEGVPLGDVERRCSSMPACDVAVLVAREGDPIELGPDASGARAVRRCRARLGRARARARGWPRRSGAPLKLLGAAGQTDEGKSVTRMLADAGLLVQQATGIVDRAAGGRWRARRHRRRRQPARGCSCSACRIAGGTRVSARPARRSPTRRPSPVLFVRRGHAARAVRARRRTSRSSGGRWPAGPSGLLGRRQAVERDGADDRRTLIRGPISVS